jgi:hypothetical protein
MACGLQPLGGNPWCAQATHVARRAVIPRFSSAQLFQVVADVPSYKEFVPWVVGSRIVRRESVRRKALCRHDHAPGRTGSGSHPSPPPPSLSTPMRVLFFEASPTARALPLVVVLCRPRRAPDCPRHVRLVFAPFAALVDKPHRALPTCLVTPPC